MPDSGTQAIFEIDELWDSGRWIRDGGTAERFEHCLEAMPAGTRTLLDVGTGNGLFLRYVETRRPQLRAMGLEASPAGISKRLCASAIVRGSASLLPFRDNAFDVVTAFEVLEHIGHGGLERVSRELQRVAARHVLVTVPINEARRNIACPYCGCRFHRYHHVRSFSRRQLDELLPACDAVRVSEFGVSEEVRFLRAYGLLVSALRRDAAAFPPETVCPQCGYRAPKPAGGADRRRTTAGRIALRERIKGVLPRRTRRRWYLALYSKKGELR